MNNFKTQFQSDSVHLERLMTEYKTGYPNNLGAMFRQNIYVLLLVCAVLMFFFGYGALGICMLLITFWMRIKETIDRSNYADPTKLKQATERAESKYNEYPDVRDYLAKLRAEWQTVRKHKILTIIVFYVLVAGFFAAQIAYMSKHKSEAGVVFFLQNMDRKIDGDFVRELFASQKNHLHLMLDLQPEKPLCKISPLHTELADGIKVEAVPIDLYVGDAQLVADTPTITGNVSGGTFRMRITDINGMPLRKCPALVFAAGDKQAASNFYRFASGEKKINTFEALQTLRYIRNNQENLRFLVERID